MTARIILQFVYHLPATCVWRILANTWIPSSEKYWKRREEEIPMNYITNYVYQTLLTLLVQSSLIKAVTVKLLALGGITINGTMWWPMGNIPASCSRGVSVYQNLTPELSTTPAKLEKSIQYVNLYPYLEISAFCLRNHLVYTDANGQ